MLGVVATMKVKSDQIAAFEDAMRELVRATRANEPATKLYQLCRSQKDPLTYVVMELYESAEALDAHAASDWFRAAGPKLGACLAERPVIEKFDAL